MSWSHSPEVRAKMSAARKRAWADPEVRAKMSAASKRALADPEVRAKMDWLSDEQKELMRQQILDGARDVDVANDWLVSTGYVAALRRRFGIQRRGGRPRANTGVGR